jgi:uncharacterized protein
MLTDRPGADVTDRAALLPVGDSRRCASRIGNIPSRALNSACRTRANVAEMIGSFSEAPLTSLPFDDLAGSWRLDTVDGPRLAQTACPACGLVMMGARRVCSGCLNRSLVVEPAPDRGTLYSFTTVHASPFSDEPYVLGYVDLEGGARVLARIVASGPLRCEQPVVLRVTADGWHFADERTP